MTAAVTAALPAKANRHAASTLRPPAASSAEAHVWVVPAVVVTAIFVGLVLRAVAPDLRYEIAFIGLGVLLVGSVTGLLLSRRA